MDFQWYAVGLMVTALVTLYFYLIRNFKYWEDRNIAYTKPHLLIGNALPLCLFKKSIANLLSDIHLSTTAKVYGFFIFDTPMLLVRDLKIIKHVLIKDFDHFYDRSIVSNGEDDKFTSTALFVCKNPLWRTIRTKITPVFTSGKIKNMTPLISKSCHGMIEFMSGKTKPGLATEFDVKDLTVRYTTDVISSCAFGISANSFKNENPEFLQASTRAFEPSITRALQIGSAFVAPMLFKLFKMRIIDAEAINFLQAAFFEALYERERTNAYKGDLIDLLIQIKKSEKEINSDVLDDNILLSQAIQFYVAGFETTGSTLFYALYELARDKEIQQKLREEIQSVLVDHADATYEEMQQMPFLDMVIAETLRKYPILSYLDRQCVKTFNVPDTDIVIEKDMVVYISLAGLHYDPENFPEPQKFIPERFSAENKPNIPQNAYMPFGDGMRNCIGSRFALITLKVGLISLLANYELELTEQSKSITNIMFNPYSVFLVPVGKVTITFEPKPLF